MKKSGFFKTIISSMALVCLCAGVSFAAPDTVKVVVNGAELRTDTPAIIRDSRTLVPFRALFEALGLNNITWDEPTQKVTGSDGKTTVELVIGSYDIYVNGQLVSMDTTPIIHNSRTMVPLSFVAKNMGADVQWDGINYIATITRKNTGNAGNLNVFPEISKIPTGQTISSPTNIDGYYALETLARKKYVMSFSNGYAYLKDTSDGQTVKGKYSFDGTTLSLSVGAFNSTFTKEDVNYSGQNILFMKDNSNPNAGQTFAMLKTTKEEFDKYTEKK